MSKGSSVNALTRKTGKSRKYDRLDNFVLAENNGNLNPDWVEYLMGWSVGWTDLQPLKEMKPLIWSKEPENVPRITKINKFRSARLKAIGNGQVPLCAATAFLLLLNRLNTTIKA